MKRHTLILLLQPYKNSLMTRDVIEEGINCFSENIANLCNTHAHLRFNLILPAYILEFIDPFKLSVLRDIQKKGLIEWIPTGYTEPFLSFSPQWLSAENIHYGASVFKDLTRYAPMGYSPPFSNWEPSQIDIFRKCGIKYAVVSKELLSKQHQNSHGYWITEHTGSSIAFFPYTAFHRYNAPESLKDWIEKQSEENSTAELNNSTFIVKYLFSLDPEEKTKQYEWLTKISEEISKNILHIQPSRVQEVLGNTPPLGLYFLPSCLVRTNNKPWDAYFLNHLHCYDQISLIQRKLMEVCNDISHYSASKNLFRLKKMLYFAQDINRFLPSPVSGFSHIKDRLWSYGRLIDIDREIQRKQTHCGQIRLIDFLRNGYKSIIMSNKNLKLYIDHKKGARVYALDYKDRSFNVCAAYNPNTSNKPDVISPNNSKLSFIDRVFPDQPFSSHLLENDINDSGNFSDAPYDYTFKKSSSGVKVVLNRQGSFLFKDKQHPLHLEKVFGLDEGDSILSFAYKLNNPSLTDVTFLFVIEMSFALPGVFNSATTLIHDKSRYNSIGKEFIQLNEASKWSIEDCLTGVKLTFKTQKKVNVIMPPGNYDQNSIPYQPFGTPVYLCCPIKLKRNSSWSFVGKLLFSKIKSKGLLNDFI
ncbi:DUF1926 domain-containing protein [Chitinispirillales bacterium ANBcel5]|uniref:alpha-amylase/4-alpha-glucanotransferase domain-containing protein n=1 Tax=Cellulosispirillum alkaliphilum TaxID=3039283 RepID=UPI002A5692CA|nr:DUF1926 domain-containing protein [Chitinispirillales bacterium ANBcel5]